MLMEQLIFLCKDIYENKIYFIWNIIQISIVGVLLSVIFQNVFEYQDVKSKFDCMTRSSEIYMFRDETSEQMFDKLCNDEKKLPGLAGLYDSLQKKLTDSDGRIRSFIADSGRKFYPADALAQSLAHKSEFSQTNVERLDLVAVSENFFEIFGLEIDGDSEMFRRSSESEEETIPIIAGSDFREICRLHEKICDQKGRQYEIVGFLHKGAYYIAPGETSKPICLDQFIVKPSRIDKKDSTDLLNYFITTYFIAEDNNFMNEIIRQSQEDGLMSLSVMNFTYQMNETASELKDQIVLNGSITVLLFAFCLVAMTGNVLQFISGHKREFAIHMMCGAGGRVIAGRLVMQIWCMYLCSVFIVLALRGVSRAAFLSLFFLAIYTGLLELIPVCILRHETIQTMLRKSYE